jgi:hypothetical protein
LPFSIIFSGVNFLTTFWADTSASSASILYKLLCIFFAASGKIFASVITILSVGTVALPAGMLASRFSEELKNRKAEFKGLAIKIQKDGQLCEQRHRLRNIAEYIRLHISFKKIHPSRCNHKKNKKNKKCRNK